MQNFKKKAKANILKVKREWILWIYQKKASISKVKKKVNIANISKKKEKANFANISKGKRKYISQIYKKEAKSNKYCNYFKRQNKTIIANITNSKSTTTVRLIRMGGECHVVLWLHPTCIPASDRSVARRVGTQSVRPGSNSGCACCSVSVSLDNGGSFVLGSRYQVLDITFLDIISLDINFSLDITALDIISL